MKSNIRLLLILLLPAAAVTAGIAFGTNAVNPLKVFTCFDGGCDPVYEVIFRLRFPRVVMALFAGAALSVSGAVFQSVFRNPLADPFITGVSGGAALGISVAVISGAGTAALPVFSFGGSMAGVVFIYLLSRRGGVSGSGLILSGVALSFIFSSSVMLLFSVARSADVHRIMIWLMGDLSYQGTFSPVWVCALILIVIVILFAFHRQLDIISMGHSFSRSTGVSEGELRLVIALASLLASLSVIIGGIIPFIGLMVPHLARGAGGPDHRGLLPLCALTGGSLLVAADTFGRSVVIPYEIPVGVVTGICGGIFFLVYVIKKRPEI